MIKQRLAVYFDLVPLDDVPNINKYHENLDDQINHCFSVLRESLDKVTKESGCAVSYMLVEEHVLEVSG